MPESAPTTHPPLVIDTGLADFISRIAPVSNVSPGACCILDSQGEVAYANRAFEALRGPLASPSPAGPRNLEDALPLSRRTAGLLRHLFASGEAGTLQGTLRGDDSGLSGAYTFTVQPIFQAGAAQACGTVLFISADLATYHRHFAAEQQTLVARIRQLSEDLRDKQALLKTLVDRSPFGFVLMNRQRQVIQLNKIAAALLCIDRRQAIGLSCEEIFRCYTVYNGCPVLERQENIDLQDTACARSCGRTFLRSTALSRERDEPLLLEVFVDITAIKESEQAKESAYEAKNDFFAKMSHELRTPLNAIIGYSELLIEGSDDLDTKESLSDLHAIRRSAHDLLHLVNQVLDITKLEANKIHTDLQRVYLGELLNEIYATVQPLVEKNRNQLIFDGDDVEQLVTDPDHLRHILLNLLSNACKFTHDGEIALRVERRAREGKEGTCFEIRDTGIGLTVEQCGRIFDKFEQADNSTTRRYGGSGLGLPIAKQLCELLGGQIAVSSAPDRGTTFSVWLPDYTLENIARQAFVSET
jgi:signal transduction histidine kinase